MESLFILAILAVFAGPVMAIIALAQISGLDRRLRKLMAETQQMIALLEKSQPSGLRESDKPESKAQDQTERAPIRAEEPAQSLAASPQVQGDEDFSSVPGVEELVPQPKAQVKPNDVEGALASRWFVWVGGAAVALGGLLFVKYAHDNGLIPPVLRVVIGLVFAGALVWAGEYIRQRRGAGVKDYVPAALSAAGIIIAFGVIYAAYALYGLVSSTVCFPALVAVGLGALWLSRRQGPLIGALGLIGSYTAPALVPSEHPSAWGFFAYLLVIACAALYELRNRDWWWLGFAAIGGSLVWGLLWMQGGFFEPSHVLPAGVFALALAAAATLVPRGKAILDDGMGSLADLKTMTMPMFVAVAGFTAMVLLLCSMVVSAHHQTLSLLLFAGGMIGICGFGWMRQGMVAAPLLAALATLAILMVWPDVGFHEWAMDERGFWSTVPGTVEPPRFAWSMIVALVSYLAVGLAGMMRKTEPRPWAALAAAAAVLFLFGAWARADFVWAENTWAALGLIFAAVLLGVAWQTRSRQTQVGSNEVAIEAVLAGVALLVLFGLDRIFDGVWYTIAIAVEALGFAWATRIWQRPMIGAFAGALASLAAIRLFVSREFWGGDSGLPLGHHWPIYGYGVPALLFWQASRWLAGEGFGRWRAALEGVALGLGVSLVSLELRVLMAGSIASDHVALAEVGSHGLAWLGAAYGLAYRQSLFSGFISKWGAWALLAASSVMLVFGLTVANPVFADDPLQGGRVFNALWIAYLAPVVLLALIAPKLDGLGLGRLRSAVGGFALVLLMVFVTLLTKRQFQDPVMSAHFMSQAESYAVSAAWLATGIMIFIAGLKIGRQTIRYGGLAVLMLAILKAFAYDLFELGGLWRIASIIGLGACLIGVGWLYTRFLQPKKDIPDEH